MSSGERTSGQRHSAFDSETESIPLDALLADVDGRKALEVELSYGTLYARRPGQNADYQVILTGPGNGFCYREVLSKRRVRNMVKTAVENGASVETGHDVWPSKWEGESR